MPLYRRVPKLKGICGGKRQWPALLDCNLTTIKLHAGRERPFRFFGGKNLRAFCSGAGQERFL